MSDTSPGLSSYHVVEHLERNFNGVLDRAEIRSCVLTAIADLRGSISAEALNEMAYRLAGYRLRMRLAGQTDSVDEDLVGAGRR